MVASPDQISNSQKFIQSLKITTTTSALLKCVGKEKEDCSICLKDFDVDEKVCFLECSHVFLESCIVKWLVQKNTCPLCRCKLYENPPSPGLNVRRRTQPRMSVRRSVRYTFENRTVSLSQF